MTYNVFSGMLNPTQSINLINLWTLWWKLHNSDLLLQSYATFNIV